MARRDKYVVAICNWLLNRFASRSYRNGLDRVIRRGMNN